MAFCGKCGNMVPKGSKFCMNCGASVAPANINNAAPVPQPVPQAPVQQPAPQPVPQPVPAPGPVPAQAPVPPNAYYAQPPQKGKSKLPVIIGIIAAVIVAGLIGFGAFKFIGGMSGGGEATGTALTQMLDQAGFNRQFGDGGTAGE